MTISLFLMVCSVSAQLDLDLHELNLLKEFDSLSFKQYDMYEHHGTYNAPWQSWAGGFHPTNRIQIDVAVDYQALQVLMSEKTILIDDLYKLFWELPMESLELFRRGNKVQVYKALYYPAYDSYKILKSKDWIDWGESIPNPYQGWYRRSVRGAPYPMNDLAIAIKRVPDVDGEPYWILSVAMFLDRKYN